VPKLIVYGRTDVVMLLLLPEDLLIGHVVRPLRTRDMVRIACTSKQLYNVVYRNILSLMYSIGDPHPSMTICYPLWPHHYHFELRIVSSLLNMKIRIPMVCDSKMIYSIQFNGTMCNVDEWKRGIHRFFPRFDASTRELRCVIDRAQLYVIRSDSETMLLQTDYLQQQIVKTDVLQFIFLARFPLVWAAVEPPDLFGSVQIGFTPDWHHWWVVDVNYEEDDMSLEELRQAVC
jgi:hypothetical protein